MSSPSRIFLVSLLALGIVGFALSASTGTPSTSELSPLPQETAQTANVVSTQPDQGPVPELSSFSQNADEEGVVARIPDPYPLPPESFLTVKEQAQISLVNIFCTGNGSLRPISGSGVIIDPRGVILTNAHVAQYVLLSQSERVSLSCLVRYGAPAQSLWEVEVLYIPPVWIHEHASDIAAAHPTGTGEHDYALLRIVSPAPSEFPALPIDTRNGISFLDDFVLVASYPAEFVGEDAAEYALYPVSSVTQIRQLLTFSENNVDLISLSGTIEAQGGSSGGPVVNAWSHLVGIITTMSDGDTPPERDLRALTLRYIDRDLQVQAGVGLAHMLAGDIAARSEEYRNQHGPALIQLLIDALSN